MIFDPPVWSLSDFEKAHNINHIHLYRLRELGLQPRTIVVGKKAMVTREAAVEWRKKIEEYAEQHGGRIEI